MNEPTFTRGEVSKILGVTPVTIANREKKKKYPPPSRDFNNYRVYSLSDVLRLQLLTFSKIDTAPIISVLYDKGIRDPKALIQIMDKAVSNKKNNLLFTDNKESIR